MCDCSSTEQFWKQVDDANTRTLVTSAINAGRAQVEYMRAVIAAQRMTILLGTNASGEYEAAAEMHHRRRNWQLQNTKQAFAQFAASLEEASKQRASEFLKGSVRDFTTYARQSAVLSLLHADLSPDMARQAVNALDRSLGRVASLTSWQEMADSFNQHLDELQAQAAPEASSINGWCLLILILSSVYYALAVTAIFSCLFSNDPECANAILTREVDDICAS
jgi:hypothetical protein